MSSQFDALLIDIGNTQAKLMLANSDDVSIGKVYHVPEIAKCLPYVEQAKRVIFASVASDMISQQLIELAEKVGVPILQVKTQAEAFGVRNAYKVFHTLGVDRWLTVVAAAQNPHKVNVVIDLGTAATVDVIDEQQHKGGWIVPGYKMLRESVTSQTAKVFADDNQPSAHSLGESTPNCVKFGCVAMLHGLIRQAIYQVRQEYDDFHLILCGGDAHLINLDEFEISIQHEANFVFYGLKRYLNQ